MKKRTLILLFILLLLAGSAQAASSPAYRIEWNNLLSGGGGLVSSTSYRVNSTVGQTARGSFSSPLYQVQAGYWAGFPSEPSPTHFGIYLPSILK